jgi:Ankyrin repeats (3 copies)
MNEQPLDQGIDQIQINMAGVVCEESDTHTGTDVHGVTANTDVQVYPVMEDATNDFITKLKSGNDASTLGVIANEEMSFTINDKLRDIERRASSNDDEKRVIVQNYFDVLYELKKMHTQVFYHCFSSSITQRIIFWMGKVKYPYLSNAGFHYHDYAKVFIRNFNDIENAKFCLQKALDCFEIIIPDLDPANYKYDREYNIGYILDALKYALKKTDDIDLGQCLLLRDVNENTFLHYVSMCGDRYVGIAAVAIDKGVSVDMKNHLGQTPLHLASDCCLEIAKLLTKHGACINTKDNNGRTALLLAIDPKSNIYEEHIKFVKYLLENGADTEVMDMYGNYALALAITMGQFEIAQCLLQHGANIERKDSDGKTALHLVSSGSDCSFEMVEYLFHSGANVETKDNDGRTALQLAILSADCTEIVEYLLQNGADIENRDNGGSTALHLAIRSDDGRSGTSGKCH